MQGENMPRNDQVEVSKLSLDLENYRTVEQPDENHALHTMISISPDRFWALLESILDDGYHLTENIIVQEFGSSLLVREGNRRIAALKIANGLISYQDIPQHLRSKIDELSNEWKEGNKAVPCIIYSANEQDKVDKIVSLTHAKGEKASRDAWNAVARTRYDRKKKSKPTPITIQLSATLKAGQ